MLFFVSSSVPCLGLDPIADYEQLMEPDKSDDWCWKSMKAGMKLDADTESDWTFFDPIKNFIKNRSTTCEQLDDPETLYREVLE